MHLLRHGEVHNPTGVLYGRLPDFHLSDLGREMAETVGAHLADHDVTVVVASPLDRAQETAAPIASAHGLSITTDDRVIEADNYFEGKTFGVGDGSLRYPKHWPKLVNPFKPSWGEPYQEIADRMLAAIADARAFGPGSRGRDRLPPAAGVDRALQARGSPPVARPAQAPVLAGLLDLPDVPG